MFLNNLINMFNLTSSNEVSSFLDELKKALNKPSTIFYTVDRIEGNFAVCENSNTLKMEDILLSELPKNIKEGSIIKFENNKYYIDLELENKRKEDLKEKISKAWKKE